MLSRTSPSQPLASLPEEVARSVRTAFVPPHLRKLVAMLPTTIALEARLGSAPPIAAHEWLKLATLERRVEIVGLAAGAESTVLTLSVGDRRLSLDEARLARPLDETLRAALIELLPPEAFADALQAFALAAAKLSALQTLTSHMLRAEDVDQAIHAMLSGITSGYGLGFHRVALFQFDESRGGFAGTRALGPYDRAEAHRVWEEIELEDKSLDSILSDYTKRNVDARFEQHVQSITLASAAPRDEVQVALDAPQPQRFAGEALQSASLRALSPAREFVLAAIRAHGKVRGLLFADDRYGGETVSDERLSFLGFFIDQLALVWENLTLLRRVEREARFDALTGVYTRRAFEERLHEEQARAARTGDACGLLVIDVDRFKEINDAEGHAAGDAVLRTLGTILKRDLRTHDVVGRLGGDEFVVLLPGAREDDCAIVARRVGEASRAQGISLSIGGASWPEHCPSPDDLLAVADAKLYDAKRGGRGRVSLGGVLRAFREEA